MICRGQPIRSRSSIASAASFAAAAGFAQSGSNSRTRRRASRVGCGSRSAWTVSRCRRVMRPCAMA